MSSQEVMNLGLNPPCLTGDDNLLNKSWNICGLSALKTCWAKKVSLVKEEREKNLCLPVGDSICRRKKRRRSITLSDGDHDG